MKTILFAVALGALALGGCGTTLATSPAPVVSTANTLVDERVLFGAEAAYNVAATAYLAADDRGQLTPQVKPRAKSLLQQAYAALLLARRAQAAGEAPSFAAQAAAVVSISAELTTFLERR